MEDWLIFYKKSIADVVGIIPAILYTTLQRKAKYYAKNGMINEHGEFYATTSDIQSVTSMSIDQIKLAIKKLESAGLLVVKVRGTPPKRHFKLADFTINEKPNKCESHLMENPLIKNGETHKCISEKPTNVLVKNPPNIKYINKSINKNINKNIELGNFLQNSNASEKPKTQKFIKPKIEEVKELMSEKLMNEVRADIESQKFINHYESNGWKVGKNPMKNWRAAVAQWCTRIHEEDNKPKPQPFKRNCDKTSAELADEGADTFFRLFGVDLNGKHTGNENVVDVTNGSANGFIDLFNNKTGS